MAQGVIQMNRMGVQTAFPRASMVSLTGRSGSLLEASPPEELYVLKSNSTLNTLLWGYPDLIGSGLSGSVRGPWVLEVYPKAPLGTIWPGGYLSAKD